MESGIISEEEKLKLRTICEFLISKRFQEIADFNRFEKCFKPLFKNEKISLRTVFDFIVNVFDDAKKKLKYITYTRFYEAYLKYKIRKNEENKNNDISIFFEKLINSITKIAGEKNVYVGYNVENNFSSKNYLDDKLFEISRVVIICNKNRKILGIKLEYNDEQIIIKMYNQNDLYLANELKLETEVKNNLYKLEIRDSITHIFGTFKEKINYIGFKCASGKMICFGNPSGESFLFGCYGKKLQCLDLKIDEDGIKRLEVCFTKNLLINKKIEYKMEDLKKLYYDEKIMIRENTKNYELIRMNQFIKIEDEPIDKFEQEDVPIKPTILFLKEDNPLNKDSTIILSEDKNYSYNPNPFLHDKKKSKIIIPNPFFKNAQRKENNQFKEIEIIVKPNFYQSINFGIFNPNSSILEELNKTEIIEKKESIEKMMEDENKKKQSNEKFLNIKNDLKTKIIQKLLSKSQGEIDIITQLALNHFIQEDDEHDKNNDNKKQLNNNIKISRKKQKEEEKELETEKDKKEEKREEKREATKFLLEEIGLDENEQNKIINNIEKNEKEFNNSERKITINENIIKNISKEFNEINQNLDKKGSKELFAKSINLLNYINKFKIISLPDENKNNRKKEENKNVEDNSEINVDLISPIIEEKEKPIKEKEIEGKENKIDGNQIEENKALKDLKKDYGNIIKKYQEEYENEQESSREKEYGGFLIINNDERLNVLLESFYKRRIDKKIFGKEQFPKKLRLFKDNEFNSKKALGVKFKKLNWIRMSDTSNKNYFIFKNEPNIENIKQSKNLNNCYFLSALGALCDKNTYLIKKLFHNIQRTKEQVYGIYFYINGKRKLILIDEYFAFDKKNNLFYGSSYDKSEIWVSLIEKAWAKLKGSYENTNKGEANEAFEALTGAFTKQIKIKKINKDRLWNILKDSKDFPICAGTINSDLFDDNFSALGLKDNHEYTIMEIIEKKLTEDNIEKKIALRDPYGENKSFHKCEGSKKGRGMFTISYDDFRHYFTLVEINYIKNGLNEKQIKISKKESKKCQFIQIENKFDNNEIYINLYQKNKQKAEFGYLMLIKEKKIKDTNKFKYIIVDSITSLKEEKKDNNYYNHIALNKISLKKGKYYICSDINYRFVNKDDNERGYIINLFSNNDLEVKNITNGDKINLMKIFHDSIYNYIEDMDKNKLEINPGTGIIRYNAQVYLFKNKEKFPFDIFYIENGKRNKIKIEFSINETKVKEIYAFYNDNMAKETDNKVIKELELEQREIIMVMNFKFSFKNERENKKYICYEVLIQD